MRFDPFWTEVKSAFKRHEKRMASNPAQPSIFTLPPSDQFLHACTAADVRRKLELQQPEHLEGLRAVFLLSGTRKQLITWGSQLGCYGCYWNRCIFLCAHPVEIGRFNLDTLKAFYLKDVLIHEIGHHVDRDRRVDHKTQEGYACWFAQEHG